MTRDETPDRVGGDGVGSGVTGMPGQAGHDGVVSRA